MEIVFGNEARQKIKSGVDKLANSVKCTLGPRGRHATIERKRGGPLITKDGVTVARSIMLDDKLENMGAQIVKSVASNTNFMAGDGTTTATVLAQEIFSSGNKMVGMGYNPILIKRGMDIALENAISLIDELKIDVEGDKDMVQNVARISANNDSVMGKQITDVIFAVGSEGLISVEQGFGETKVDYCDGYFFERGMLSPSFVTNHQHIKCDLKDAVILIYDGIISLNSDIIPALNIVSESNKEILIVAQDVQSEALQTIVYNNSRGAIKACVVKAPGFGDIRHELMEDLALFTGGTLISKEMSASLRNIDESMFGRADKVSVGRNETTIIGGAGLEEIIENRVSNLKDQLEDSTLYDHQIASIKQRLSKLTGGAAILKVGGSSEAEILEKKDRVEDAINAVQAAISDGIVPGGGSGFLHIHNDLKKAMPSDLTQEELLGYEAVLNATLAPFKQICYNAGVDFYENMYSILGGESKRRGFDALKLVMVDDMLEAGIVDPAKVLKSAIKNAVSACGTLLTTEVAIFEKEPSE